MLNRASLLTEVWPDHERFASSGAIAVPPMPAGLPLQAPIAIDPPEHHYFRHPVALAVSPRRIQEYTAQARTLAIELIEGSAPRANANSSRTSPCKSETAGGH